MRSGCRIPNLALPVREVNFPPVKPLVWEGNVRIGAKIS